jgi:lipoprotein-releasing system permease protein
MPEAGWTYRRMRVAQEAFYRQQMEKLQQQRQYQVAQNDVEGAAPPRPDSALDQPGLAPSSTDVPPIGDLPPMAEDPFAELAEEEPQGELFDPAQEQHIGIVLGIATSSIRHRMEDGEVVDVFLCKPGDDVKITLPTAGAPPKLVSANFTVVDFYESKMSEYDASFAFIPIDQLQYLRGMIHPQSGVAAVNSIQLKLRPGANLNAARDALRERFPAELFPYRIQTWKDLQGPLLAAVQMETTILNILLFLIIAVAGFGILATFFMIVVEKTRDIGILKALGATRRGVMSIFLAYGLSLGCVGSGVGMVLGLLFVANINRIAALLESITGREVFDPTIYYFQEIPTIVSPLTVTWIVTGAMMIAMMASVLPALRAARMHPVEALRYE